MEIEAQDIIGIEGLKHFMRNIYLVSHVEREKPLGVLLVADPGKGKSFILNSIIYKNALTVSDVTGRGLQNIISRIEESGYRYIVVPDLIKVLARQGSKQAFTTLAGILLEEGVRYIEMHNLKINPKHPIRCGLISAITPYSLKREYNYFEGIGFISRHLIIAFDYCAPDEEQIKDSLLLEKEFKTIPVPIMSTISIELPKNLIKITKQISHLVATQRGDADDFRSIKQIRAMLKAEALNNGRTQVNMGDVKNILCLLPYIITINNSNQIQNSQYNFFNTDTGKPASDADYLFLKHLFFGEKYKYEDKFKKISAKRLIKMKLLEVDKNTGALDIASELRV